MAGRVELDLDEIAGAVVGHGDDAAYAFSFGIMGGKPAVAQSLLGNLDRKVPPAVAFLS